jgi:hypothetical protein
VIITEFLALAVGKVIFTPSSCNSINPVCRFGVEICVVLALVGVCDLYFVFYMSRVRKYGGTI